MKILYYCQHVLGIGHFFRSMHIASALHKHTVFFVEGGDPLPEFRPPPHVYRIFLPPIMMDPHFRNLETHGRDLKALQKRRVEKLLTILEDTQPDVLLIELFPFGRKKFRFELIPLLEANRKRPRRARVVCSLRDILVEKDDPETYENRVLEIINRYFDLLLVHGDPDFIALDETFSRIDEILPPVVYTGYVTPPPPDKECRPVDGRIVVSTGGGRVGTDLLENIIKAALHLSNESYRFHIFQGPFLESEDRMRLQEMSAGNSKIVWRSFTQDFVSELGSAMLSVSMAGYNTCMDILTTGVRALVYPFPQNREQRLRAERLEERGIVRVLRTLDPLHIAREIESALVEDRPPSNPPRRDGAVETARAIENLAGKD